MRDHALSSNPGALRGIGGGVLAWVAAGLALLLVAISWPAPVAAASERDRVALVVGNGHYEHLPSLENPYNDAKRMAAALWQAGFETIELLDADREGMIAAIATFANRIDAGTDAVFFYAGHGVQSGGSNYLLPTSTTLEDANDLSGYAIDANQIVGLMGGNEAHINIVILDACRDNPFLVSGGPSLAGELAEIDPALLDSSSAEIIVRTRGGLAPLTASRAETVVGYATGPGEVALDGEGDNSPYTAALLEHIDTPGLEIGMMFRRVRATVREITNGWQIPWMASTLESEFYFRPLVESAAVSLEEALKDREEDIRKLGLAPPKQLVEEAFWRVVSAGGERDDFLAYLQRYPEGAFAAQAQARIDELDGGGAIEIADDGVQVAYLGVGPVPVVLPDEAPLGPGVLGVRVRAVPTSGTLFRRDNTRIMVDHLVGRSELAGLRFLPRVGTKSVGLVEPLTLVSLSAEQDEPWTHWIKSEIHPCDLLAGFRAAPDRVWDGVQQAILRLDPESAIDACLLGVSEYPDVVRFAALLARAYRAAERWAEARSWAGHAMERGYGPGIGQLGTMMMRGNGAPPDYPRALELLQQAYELGVPAAATRIGEMHQAGLGVPEDPARAATWYRRSFELGDAFGGTQLARLYEKGAGVERDMDRAIALYQDSADAGELSAQLRLARIYLEGIGVEPDPDAALEVLRAAAGTGMPTGQKGLGQFYEEQEQIDQAVYWYEKADAQGEPWAPLYLGRLYLDHAALGPDAQRAVEYLETALERSNANAARPLAKIYESDKLGAPSKEMALRYHRRAAEAGNAWSMRDLARALLAGDGVERDVAAGITWMTRAADGGNPWAQRDLGTSFATGDLVERDPLQAARYLGLALGADEAGAAGPARDRLEQLLSASERVRATQTWLAALGYDVGTADGLAGAQTEAAIARFAADQGVEPAAAGSADLIVRLAPLVGGPADG